MILYYSPGACSLADHIALYEAGLKFSVVKVDLETHTIEDGRPLSDINPKNYVPVLQLDDGELLTENIAILSFIADKAPALIPPGPAGSLQAARDARLHLGRDTQGLRGQFSVPMRRNLRRSKQPKKSRVG